METIMMAIHKQHIDNMRIGAKRFEGRKRIPKEIPIMNYIEPTSPYVPSEKDIKVVVYEPKKNGGCGKVVGSFMCDFAQSFRASVANYKEIAEALCITQKEAEVYFNSEYGFMLRVCNYKDYDRPRELGEFRHAEPKNCSKAKYGEVCIGELGETCKYIEYYRCCNKVKYAPQSYIKIADTERV